MKIIQNGNEFIGRCMIGGKKIGKNEEAVKGKISNGKLEEPFVSYPIDQITFKLDWNKARTTINKDIRQLKIYRYAKTITSHQTLQE